MIRKFHSDLRGRQRYLALGQHYASAVTEIRARGLDAALEAVGDMGGVSQPRGLARSLLRELQRNPEFGSRAYEIRDRTFVNGVTGERLAERMVFIPHLGWYQRGRRQLARLEMCPMFGGTFGRTPKRLP